MTGYCEDCGETICVCQNPHDVLSKWTDDTTKQLEAAKQRELTLLAVIDAMIEVLVIVDDEYCYSNDDRVTDVLRMAEERRKK